MNSVSKEQTPRTYSYMHKIKLKDDIEKKLEQKELIEILKILVENNIKLSQNYTGVLFDLKYVPDYVLEKIEQYITFCSDNRKNQLENDNLKMEYKKELKPESYKYDSTIDNKNPPLSNLYQKYTNIGDQCNTMEIPTYKIENNQSVYKINNSKIKTKNKYNKKIDKFNHIVNKTSKKTPININIDEMGEMEELNEIDEMNEMENEEYEEDEEYEENEEGDEEEEDEEDEEDDEEDEEEED